MSKQNTLIIDLDRCIGCHGCHVACKQENNVALGLYWNQVVTIGPKGDYPNTQMYFLPLMCQECKEPSCVKVCPTQASYRAEDGVVLIDHSKCIGCKLCMKACPYGARSFNPATNVVEKCTTCAHLRQIDEKPACVKNCVGKARLFGDINDPNSEVSQALKRAGAANVHALPDKGTHPSTRYILHAKMGTWMTK
ncbi:MAG: 4Fe-4S dicluster domain-containing protein [Acidobacteriota bacterium]|nr:4Fe-4S dicluster domain-containing protein [Acidobacteriota bacterium]